MKLKVGFVSKNRQNLEKIKTEFSSLIFIYAQNVMELSQHSSSKSLDCIIIMDTHDSLSKEFYGCYSYLRQKPNFKQTPIFAVADSKIVASAPIQDKKVRSYGLKESFFTTLIDGFSHLTQLSDEQIVTDEKMIAEFSDAMTRKFNKAGAINARIATPDESHSSFISQSHFEIASNLYWVKFSTRVLSKNKESLQNIFNSKDDTALNESLVNLQNGIFESFKEHIDEILDNKGALNFKKSDQLNMADKAAFIKKATSRYYIFESPSLSIVLENIQYI